MAAVTVPSFDFFETIEAVADFDEWGLATARVSYYAKDAKEAATLLRDGQTCPLIEAGLLQSARFLHGSAESDGAGDVWKVHLFWKGVGYRIRAKENAIPNYKPTAGTAPIDTHPTFQSFAGTPDSRLNNAQFDDQGSFVRFPPFKEDGVTKNPKAGVTNYYQAALQVAVRQVAEATDDLAEDQYAVGKISVPDIENLLELKLRVPGFTSQKRNFLLASLTIEDLGQGWVMTERQWDMSGPVGWDDDIYAYEDTGDAKT